MLYFEEDTNFDLSTVELLTFSTDGILFYHCCNAVSKFYELNINDTFGLCPIPEHCNECFLYLQLSG